MFGRNHHGQLGLGDTKDRRVLTEVELLRNMDIAYISCGKSHSALIDDNFEVFTWGSNKSGQLGLGSNQQMVEVPTALKMSQPFAKVRCGYSNTMLLSKSGEVFVCGRNEGNCVSLEAVQRVSSFVRVPDLAEVEQIHCTNFFTALTKEGNLFVWGNSELWPFSKPYLLEEFRGQVANAALGQDFIVLTDFNFLVHSAGRNSKGQLGYETLTETPEFKCVEKLVSNPIKLLACGVDFCMGISGVNVKHQGHNASEAQSVTDNKGDNESRFHRSTNVFLNPQNQSVQTRPTDILKSPEFAVLQNQETAKSEANFRNTDGVNEHQRNRFGNNRLSDNNSQFIDKRPSWNSAMPGINEYDPRQRERTVQSSYLQTKASENNRLDFSSELAMLNRIEKEYYERVTPKDFQTTYSVMIEEIRVGLKGLAVFRQPQVGVDEEQSRQQHGQNSEQDRAD